MCFLILKMCPAASSHPAHLHPHRVHPVLLEVAGRVTVTGRGHQAHKEKGRVSHRGSVHSNNLEAKGGREVGRITISSLHVEGNFQTREKTFPHSSSSTDSIIFSLAEKEKKEPKPSSGGCTPLIPAFG